MFYLSPFICSLSQQYHRLPQQCNKKDDTPFSIHLVFILEGVLEVSEKKSVMFRGRPENLKAVPEGILSVYQQNLTTSHIYPPPPLIPFDKERGPSQDKGA